MVSLFCRFAIAFDWPCWSVKFAFVQSPRWLQASALHRPSGCRSELPTALALQMCLVMQIQFSIFAEKLVHWGSLTGHYNFVCYFMSSHFCNCSPHCYVLLSCLSKLRPCVCCDLCCLCLSWCQGVMADVCQGVFVYPCHLTHLWCKGVFVSLLVSR